MRRFIDYCQTSSPEKIGSVCTRRYVEMEIPLDKQLASIVYVMPQDTHSALVATCWEDIFDQPIASLQVSPYKTTYETWPLMTSLLHKTVRQKAHTSTLLRANDLDLNPSHPKWFLGAQVHGINCEQVESLIGERTQEVIEVVLAISMKLLLEVQENVPGAFPIDQLREGIACATPAISWLENILALIRRS